MKFERIASLSAQRAALRMLVRELPPAEQAGTLQMLLDVLADANQRNNLLLMQASENNEVIAVAVAQLQPGRTAILWPPRGDGAESQLTQLLLALLNELKLADVRVVQALLPLDADDDCRLMATAGITVAAELVYMVAERDLFPHSPPVSRLTWHSADANDSHFQTLVRATYVGSLDCPTIDGWREITDVLTGYLAVGTYRPDLWQIAREGDSDVGCLIVADYPTHKQWELVYFGVHPQHRGHGWGAIITQFLLWNAQQAGIERVMLAVDSLNKPARKLYHAAGFCEFNRRLVLAKQL